jgi:hypothetical protein
LPVSPILPARPAFLAGLVLFTVASLGCGRARRAADLQLHHPATARHRKIGSASARAGYAPVVTRTVLPARRLRCGRACSHVSHGVGVDYLVDDQRRQARQEGGIKITIAPDDHRPGWRAGGVWCAARQRPASSGDRTKEQLNSTLPVAALRSAGDQVGKGRATARDPDDLPGHLEQQDRQHPDEALEPEERQQRHGRQQAGDHPVSTGGLRRSG